MLLLREGYGTQGHNKTVLKGRMMEMFKKILFFLLISSLLIEGVYAQDILTYEARLEVDTAMVNADVSIVIRNSHQTSIKSLTYPFSGQIKDLKTFDEIGGLESDINLRGGKSYVTTDLRESLGVNKNTTVLYEFTEPSSITFFNDTYILSTSFPLLANVEKFALTLKLPEGTGVTEPDVDIVPAPSEITSDGRSIILKWAAHEPSEFRIFVRYEPLPPPTAAPTTVPPTPQPESEPFIYSESLLLGLVVVLLVVLLSLLTLKIIPRNRIREKIDILKEDEQLIMNIVAEDDGIGQREIQRKTDFSKTKVSKILAELEKRGAIQKVSTGKKNKIYLSKKLKE